MEHRRLYEIKIDSLEKENKELRKELEKQDLIKQGYKEEISKWNLKYKLLISQIFHHHKKSEPPHPCAYPINNLQQVLIGDQIYIGHQTPG